MLPGLSFIRDLCFVEKEGFYWVLSSAGRASPLHGGGRGFEPLSTHHRNLQMDIDCFSIEYKWSGSSDG